MFHTASLLGHFSFHRHEGLESLWHGVKSSFSLALPSVNINSIFSLHSHYKRKVVSILHLLFSPDLDLTEGEDAEESVEDVPGTEEEGAEETDGADGAESVYHEAH